MTLPLDVQCLKIALQFVKTRAKGDWEAARKLMQLDSFDTKGKFHITSHYYIRSI